LFILTEFNTSLVDLDTSTALVTSSLEQMEITTSTATTAITTTSGTTDSTAITVTIGWKKDTPIDIFLNWVNPELDSNVLQTELDKFQAAGVRTVKHILDWEEKDYEAEKIIRVLFKTILRTLKSSSEATILATPVIVHAAPLITALPMRPF